ncbi:caspase domain-containing protein [Mycena maculata]|uniref:Caspase domain-containing protein n=1 Tax=Mycena maculata TaxID=230809 RepID=A0AAD7K6X1_9AGAR|nr:caspase domain-containing protein [Mycena maculata]
MAMSQGNYSNTFALIIGIDKYRDSAFSTLKGAVHDARLFKQFLTDPHTSDGLHVPISHIKVLENEKATRNAILSAFASHLLNNPAIPDHGNAAMIFFFAGHGSRVEAQDTVSGVEVLCPCDERTGTGDAYVHGIFDYLLVRLLYQLSLKKGRNITVILDSCHSGGMAREDPDEAALNVIARSPKSLSRLSTEQNMTRSQGLWTPSAATHILLAACGSEGIAYESASKPYGGHFTRSLVDQLRAMIHDAAKTTYIELIANLPPFPVRRQIPHCGGAYVDRFVFTTNRPASGIPLTFRLKEMHVFHLAIGSKDGVRVGMEFSVWGSATPGTGRKHICTLVSRVVSRHQTACVVASQDGSQLCLPKIPEGAQVEAEERLVTRTKVTLTEESPSQAFVIPIGSFAHVREGSDFPILVNTNIADRKLTAKTVGVGQAVLVAQNGEPLPMIESSWVLVESWKRVRVYISPDFQCMAEQFDGWEVEREMAHADITLTRDKNTIVVKRVTGTAIEYGNGAQFTMGAPPALDLSRVARGIVHFHHLLEHHNQITSLSGFSLKMYRLDGNDPNGKLIYDTNNDSNSIEGVLHKITIISDPRADYGFKICNTGRHALFPYVLYFNPDDYTINWWYLPETVQGKPPLLEKSGEVTFGMGEEPPFGFWLPEGKSTSSGFVKIFLSTEHLDLTWAEQNISPVDCDFDTEGRLYAARREFFINDWADLTLVVIMNEHE